MTRDNSLRVDTAKGESAADWILRVDQEARATEIEASLTRQKRAIRAWRADRWIHRTLLVAVWAAVAAVLGLAAIGMNLCIDLWKYGAR